MSIENQRGGSLEVLSASADIPIRRFVTFKATNGLALPATAGEGSLIVGVTLEAYDDSEADLGNSSTVVAVGDIEGRLFEVEAGAALAVGTVVIPGNDGRPVATTTTAGGTVPAGTYQQLGVVVEASGAAGEVCTVRGFRGAFVTTA